MVSAMDSELCIQFEDFEGTDRPGIEDERHLIAWSVKDVCFDEGHLVVRSGKGDQDRITVLPERSREALVQQIEAVRRLHQEDLAQGFGAV